MTIKKIHPIANYLNDVGLKKCEFASILGISKGYLTQIINRDRYPAPDLALLIQAETCESVHHSKIVNPRFIIVQNS